MIDVFVMKSSKACGDQMSLVWRMAGKVKLFVQWLLCAEVEKCDCSFRYAFEAIG